jgi:hypothetical protein
MGRQAGSNQEGEAMTRETTPATADFRADIAHKSTPVADDGLRELLREAWTFVMFQDHMPKAKDLMARIDAALSASSGNDTVGVLLAAADDFHAGCSDSWAGDELIITERVTAAFNRFYATVQSWRDANSKSDASDELERNERGQTRREYFFDPDGDGTP